MSVTRMRVRLISVGQNIASIEHNPSLEGQKMYSLARKELVRDRAVLPEIQGRLSSRMNSSASLLILVLQSLFLPPLYLLHKLIPLVTLRLRL